MCAIGAPGVFRASRKSGPFIQANKGATRVERRNASGYGKAAATAREAEREPAAGILIENREGEVRLKAGNVLPLDYRQLPQDEILERLAVMNGQDLRDLITDFLDLD